LEHTIGSIEEGKEADLIAVNCRTDDPVTLVSTLIQETSTEKIRMVMVGGDVLFHFS